MKRTAWILILVLLLAPSFVEGKNASKPVSGSKTTKASAKKSRNHRNTKKKVTYIVKVTAYTSSQGETDNTPRITASGTKTRDGVAATNLLPLGTKIRIPKLFGSKVFTVEDRTHPRYKRTVDIWMASRSKAKKFGRQDATILVVRYP